MDARPEICELSLALAYRHGLGDLSPFFAGLRRGVAVATRCPSCQRMWFPPRLVCPQDRSDAAWIETKGEGAILAVTEVAGGSDGTLRHFALIRLDGCDNAIVSRVIARGLPKAGDRVRLATPSAPHAHPIQGLAFMPI
jgi:uncharacterized OB-fold protein